MQSETGSDTHQKKKLDKICFEIRHGTHTHTHMSVGLILTSEKGSTEPKMLKSKSNANRTCLLRMYCRLYDGSLTPPHSLKAL